MQLITLNIWGGHVRDPLLKFISLKNQVDIFCFQEVYHQAQEKVSDDDRPVSLNIFSEIQSLLPNHQGFFRPVLNSYGIGTFIHKDIPIVEEGEIPIYENPKYRGKGPSHSRNLQWIKCQINNEPHIIMNVHGLWNGNGKTDSPERIEQSKKIREFIDSVEAPKILCGDLNLRPDTESLKIIEKGMHNLIQIHNVTSTRTSLYPKEERFADYIFTSPEIPINTFQVLEAEVSDHAPLLIDFR